MVRSARLSPHFPSHDIPVEDGGWDTSKALVRKTLEECIRRGRAQRANGQKADEYEAYRLLGQAVRDR